MSKYPIMCIATVALCAFGALWPGFAAEGTRHEAASIPNFGPDPDTGWNLDRPAHDDFLPPPSGPGPVVFDKAHPYVPNGQGQSTYRVADLTNPILKPWVIEQMRKANEKVLDQIFERDIGRGFHVLGSKLGLAEIFLTVVAKSHDAGFDGDPCSSGQRHALSA